jgi:hypothetical protein
MRILVTGDRNWTNRERIYEILSCLPPDSVLIHGDARGADRLAASVAFDLGWEILSFPANWAEHHKAAGPIRNRKMYTEGNPDLVIAFHNDLNNSKGTKDMVKVAGKGQTGVLLVTDTSYSIDTNWPENLNKIIPFTN